MDQKEEDKEPTSEGHTRGENNADDLDSDEDGDDDDLSDFGENDDEEDSISKKTNDKWWNSPSCTMHQHNGLKTFKAYFVSNKLFGFFFFFFYSKEISTLNSYEQAGVNKRLYLCK